MDRINRYDCTCKPGYTGTNCESGKGIIDLQTVYFTTQPSLCSPLHSITQHAHQILCTNDKIVIMVIICSCLGCPSLVLGQTFCPCPTSISWLLK